jgi:(2R)-3-sulfolactate dehydrogenase (NADP+)
LVGATLSAERSGRPEVGLRHLLDYLQGFVDGRIDGQAEPVIDRPAPSVIRSDACSGIAQLGFDLAYDEFVGTARSVGTALFTQRNSYTAGELGYYVRRLAQDGLVSIAVANGPPLMAASPGGKPVYCTNPLAFGAPCRDAARPLVIDQASSSTAFVKVVQAAETGAALPEGWAVDAAGDMTTDAQAALGGALLPFGGYKGANIALMVEVLAAGLSGASWSMDAGNFRAGTESPKAGLTIIAISPIADERFEPRLTQQLYRLKQSGVHVPGVTTAADQLVLEEAVLERIMEFSRGGTQSS